MIQLQVECRKQESFKSHCNRTHEGRPKEVVAEMEEQVKADLFKLSEILITSCNRLDKKIHLFDGH